MLTKSSVLQDVRGFPVLLAGQELDMVDPVVSAIPVLQELTANPVYRVPLASASKGSQATMGFLDSKEQLEFLDLLVGNLSIEILVAITMGWSLFRSGNDRKPRHSRLV